MADSFAFKWAYGCLALMMLAFIVDMVRIGGGLGSGPRGSLLPSSVGGAFATGAIYGAIMIGPIVYRSFRRWN